MPLTPTCCPVPDSKGPGCNAIVAKILVVVEFFRSVASMTTSTTCFGEIGDFGVENLSTGCGSLNGTPAWPDEPRIENIFLGHS